MSKKLLKRTEFAALAGVNASAVTRACDRVLAPATVGKMIDANHPAALEYVERQVLAKSPQPLIGVDPRHEEALEHCKATGRWSASAIQRGLKMGYHRAAKIFGMLDIAGLVPEEAKQAALPKTKTPRAKPSARKESQSKKTTAQQAPPPEEEIHIPDNMSVFYEMKLAEIVAIFGTDARFVDWLNSVQKIEAINEKRLKNATTEGKLIHRDLVQAGVLDNIDAAFTRMLTDGRQTISSRSHAIANSGGSVEDVDKVVGDLLGSFIKPAKKKMERSLKNA